ncbi:MAG TPA: CDP-alcohol phosphatidyltransferase family protein [Polyangia bacterium]|nr:CDP-alcohol phosphatidyltransferase family protein [Polyangia bacterium]
MRLSIGPFGVKDLFTLVNLMGGVAAVYYLFDGRLQAAGTSLLLGYLLGDALDGYVARLTNTSNRFGSEFDTATDHLVQAIVPAIVVFVAYAHGGQKTVGFVLMSVIMACATIRQAIFSVARMGDPLMYCGLPRTVSGYASMAFVLSHTFQSIGGPLYGVGAVLIVALAVMGLLPIPYMTHRGARRMQTYVKVLVLLFLVTPILAIFVARDYTFDVLFIWMFGYAAGAWIPLHKDERASFFARYREWAGEVTRA